jgi:drug/metabolite transporter (DMT)-like permease
VVPLAHATGALAGLLCAALALASAGGPNPGRHESARAADGRKAHLDTLAVLLLLGCCAIWGLGQVAVKVALQQVPPLLQAGVRSLVAAALLLLWARLARPACGGPTAPARPGCWPAALFAAEFGCIFLGLQYTSASRMVGVPVPVAFCGGAGHALHRAPRKLRALQVAGLVLAFAGVVWAFAEGFVAAGRGAAAVAGRRAGHRWRPCCGA